MASHVYKLKSGAAKLSEDMATLINNRQGSDIQFKVGGAIYDESTMETLYAHSVILRCRSEYFATMLDDENNSKGIIYKPSISPGTFQDVLHYIYTGNVPAKTSENIIELIATADEMKLEELSFGCQKKLIRMAKYIFIGEDDRDGKNKSIVESEESESTKYNIPIDVAISTYIIPALNLACNRSLPHLSQELLAAILPNISMIVESLDVYTTFINNISSQALTKIISSDDLAMNERNVWDLALRWACYQTNTSKAAVEARLANLKDDDEYDNEELSDEEVISDVRISKVKKTLAPLLPPIRFSLLDPDDYALMADTLNYLLPRRRYSELNRYFISANRTGQLDIPRKKNTAREIPPKIKAEPTNIKVEPTKTKDKPPKNMDKPPPPEPKKKTKDEPPPPEPKKKNKFYKIRCKYWPHCNSKSCKYIHPRTLCKDDGFCKLGDKCTYMHSSDDVKHNEYSWNGWGERM